MNDQYIYGIHPLMEALEGGKQPEKVFIQQGLSGEGFTRLFQRIRQLRIPFQYVPVEKLNRITRKNHQGVVAFISLVEYQDLSQVLPALFEAGETPLIVVLDGITDVRNLGAIARTAECAGAHALVFSDKSSAPVNADAIKTSAGALTRIPVCRETSIPATITFLKACGLKTLTLDEKSRQSIYEASLHMPLAVIMGSEERGVSSATKKLSDDHVSIPMKGHIASLNVSVATGIVLFEAVRQRSSLA